MPLTKDVKDTFPPPPHVIVSFFLLRMVESPNNLIQKRFKGHSAIPTSFITRPSKPWFQRHPVIPNLVPRVFELTGQRGNYAGDDSGKVEFAFQKHLGLRS